MRGLERSAYGRDSSEPLKPARPSAASPQRWFVTSEGVLVWSERSLSLTAVAAPPDVQSSAHSSTRGGAA